jgi:hypothetical protein
VKPWSALLYVSCLYKFEVMSGSLRVKNQVLAHDLYILSAYVDLDVPVVGGGSSW